MKFSNLFMCTAVVFILMFALFSAPVMSHAELPPGGDAALMGLSDSVSTTSATVVADKAMSFADEALITTSAVAARTREHTFNLMDEHNMITPALYSWKPCPSRIIAKSLNPNGGWHSPPQRRKILLA